MAGRKKTRPEAAYIEGKTFIKIPMPTRNEEGDLVGYEWKQTDLIKLLNTLPEGYSPFREAEGYFFSVKEAEIIINFIIHECRFPEGKLTGKPFVPERWQWAVYLNTYCWFRKDRPHVRRYNEVFIYVPRKNGKTTAFGAIPALISIFVDPELRSQNFCCAADTEQAALNFRHAAYMVEKNPRMLNRLTSGKIRYSQRYMEHNNGKHIKVLSSIADTKHGLSPNYVGVDEVHAHPDSELIDVMVTGTGSRESPLIIYTTTADYDRPSKCNDLLKTAEAICKGTQSDPSFLPVVYQAKVTDDWDDPKVWRKANPNFGVSIYENTFRREVNRVRNNPALLNRFLRLHLNIKTSVETAWIMPHIWAATVPVYRKKQLLSVQDIRTKIEEYPDWFNVVHSPIWEETATDLYLKEYRVYWTWFFQRLELLQGETCYGGFDNSAKSDIASFSLWFPDQRTLLLWNWVPSASIERRSIEDGIRYKDWHAAGLINNTPLERTDEESIIKALTGGDNTGILDYFEGIEMVAFDSWGSNMIYKAVDDHGVPAASLRQNFQAMNQPCKFLEAAVANRDIHHGGQPVLSWMIGNTMVKSDHNDYIRPCRQNSTDKIDGVVSSLMAISAWMYQEDTIIDELPGLTKQD